MLARRPHNMVKRSSDGYALASRAKAAPYSPISTNINKIGASKRYKTAQTVALSASAGHRVR